MVPSEDEEVDELDEEFAGMGVGEDKARPGFDIRDFDLEEEVSAAPAPSGPQASSSRSAATPVPPIITPWSRVLAHSLGPVAQREASFDEDVAAVVRSFEAFPGSSREAAVAYVGEVFRRVERAMRERRSAETPEDRKGKGRAV